MLFFPPPYKMKDAGLGVTEDPLDGCGGTEAGEAIGIMEASVFLHTEILPAFPEDENTISSVVINVFQVKRG
jgi:hypothetical protein